MRLVVLFINDVLNIFWLNLLDREVVNDAVSVFWQLAQSLLADHNVAVPTMVGTQKGKLGADIGLLDIEVASELAEDMGLLIEVGRA